MHVVRPGSFPGHGSIRIIPPAGPAGTCLLEQTDFFECLKNPTAPDFIAWLGDVNASVSLGDIVMAFTERGATHGD